MMLRRVYCWLVRLHPARFRERFGEEMLSIFDQARGAGTRAPLVGDAALSLLRQWAVRSQYVRESGSEPVLWSPQGPPVFYVFDHYIPSKSSLWAGVFFALTMCCATWLISRYTWNHPVFMPTIDSAGLLGSAETDSSARIQPEKTLRTLPMPHAAIAVRQGVPSQPTTKIIIPSPAHVVALGTQRSAAAVSPRATVPASASNARSQPPAAIPSTAVQQGAPVLVPPTPPDRALFPYIGEYVADPPNDFDLVVTDVGGHLVVQIPGESATTLVPVIGDRFVFAGAKNDWVEFERKSHGIADELTMSRNGRKFTAHRTK